MTLIIRDVSRTIEKSKMEFFVTIVNGRKPLARVLDTSLVLQKRFLVLSS